MSLASTVAALLTNLARDQVEAMPPLERRHLADQCRRIAALADPVVKGAEVQGGVLADLQTRRDE